MPSYFKICTYLGEAADGTANGCAITCNHTSVHKGSRELGGTANVLLLEGCTVMDQSWTSGEVEHVLVHTHTHKHTHNRMTVLYLQHILVATVSSLACYVVSLNEIWEVERIQEDGHVFLLKVKLTRKRKFCLINCSAQ